MNDLLTLTEFLRTALANRAARLTLRSGLPPVIFSGKGDQICGSQTWTAEVIEEFLRRLVSSRELREFRTSGVVDCLCVYEHVSLQCSAHRFGENVRLDLRKMTGEASWWSWCQHWLR